MANKAKGLHTRKILQILLLTLFFILPVVYTRNTYNHFEFVKEIYTAIILGLVLVVWSVVWKGKRKWYVWESLVIAAAALALVLNVFSKPGAVNIREDFYLLMIVAGAYLFSDRELMPTVEKVLYAIVIGGTVAVVVGYLQKSGFLMNWRGEIVLYDQWHGAITARANYQGHWPTSSIISTMGNENFFSEFLLLLVIIIGALWQRTRNKGVRFFFALLGLGSIALLFIIFTRATIVALLATLLYLGWLRLAKQWRILTLIALVVLLLIGGSYYMHRGIQDSNIKNRILMYKIGMSLTTHKPILGYGFGFFKYIYPRYQGEYFLKTEEYKGFNVGRAEHTHNELIQLLVENGVLLSSLVILIFVLFFWREHRNLGGVAVFAVTVNALFSFPMHILPVGLIVLLFLVQPRDATAHTPTAALLETRRTFPLRLVLLLVGAALVVGAIRLYVGSAYFKRATILDKIKKSGKAPASLIMANGTYYYEHALKFLPEDIYDNEIRYKYMEFLKGNSRYLKKRILLGRQAFRLNKNIIATNYDWARALYERGQNFWAEYAFRISNAINPREPTIYAYLMRLSRNQPERVWYWYRMGQLYARDKGELLKAALELQDRAVINDFIEKSYSAGHTDWAIELARFFSKQNQLRQADRFYADVVKGSRDLNVLLEATNYYLKTGRLVTARGILEQMKRYTRNAEVLREIEQNIGAIDERIKENK